MGVNGTIRNRRESVSDNNRRIGDPYRASEFLSKRVEVMEFIGVPGGIRTLVCAVKETQHVVTD